MGTNGSRQPEGIQNAGNLGGALGIGPLGINQLNNFGPLGQAPPVPKGNFLLPFNQQNALNQVLVDAMYARFRSSVDLNGLQQFAGLNGYYLLSNNVNKFVLHGIGLIKINQR